MNLIEHARHAAAKFFRELHFFHQQDALDEVFQQIEPHTDDVWHKNRTRLIADSYPAHERFTVEQLDRLHDYAQAIEQQLRNRLRRARAHERIDHHS